MNAGPQPDNRQQEATGPEDYTMYERGKRAFGPIVAGLILDLADLATFGPIGIFAGLIVGFAVGYWICSIYRLPLAHKITGGIIAGLYCMIPGTGPIPIAAIVGCFVRFFERKPKPKPAPPPEEPAEIVDETPDDGSGEPYRPQDN